MAHVPKLDMGADDRRTAVFRALVARLRSDPVLKRVVRTWRTWDGTPGEAAEPTLKELPWVRVSPSGLAVRPETLGTSTAPVRIAIEVCVGGTLVDNLTNLWGRIHTVLLPGDGTVQTLIEGHGGYRLAPDEPAFGTADVGGSACLAAEGSFVVNQLVRTRT